MNGIQDLVLIGEIALQSKIARRAVARLLATHDSLDRLEVWSSIQSILCATANVSKILWPTGNYQARGERLRKILNVGDDHLLKSRKFRNYFEHYDEQVDEWFRTQPSAVYTDLSMNPGLRGPFARQDHRGYNSFNNTVVFRGEELDLNEILKALDEIVIRCNPYTLRY